MAEARPTVSAVIPAYNASDTIARALNSVYAQEYDNIIEVIVVDDGSSDNTAAIVREKYPDVIVIQQHNAGAAAARNVGIEHSNGEYIALLDSDDEWFVTKLERQVQYLQSNPAVDFCGCLLELVTGTGQRVRRSPESIGEGREICFVPYLRREYPPMTVTPIGRRAAIASVGGFDPEMRAHNDLDFWLRILAAGYSVVVLQEYLHRWYIRGESLCHGRRGLAKHQCMQRILDRWAPTEHPIDKRRLMPDEYAGIRWNALAAAARDHAYYGENKKAREYARQAMALEGGSTGERLSLRGLAHAPAVYGASARAVEAGKSILRRFRA